MIFMSKFKNSNIALATVFSVISVLFAFFSMGYIFSRYPVSVNGFFLFSSELLIFFSATFLLTGILSSKKIFITLSGILLFSKALINFAFFLLTNSIQGLYYPLFYPVAYGYTIVNFLLLLAEIVAFFVFLLYTFGVIKNRNLIFALLFIAWVAEFATSMEFTPALFTLSAFILLVYYTDITNPSSEVNMGEIFAFSIVTFGAYYVIWAVTAVKKISILLSRNVSFSEYLFFILFPPYTAYWYYTRYEDLSKSGRLSENRGILCFVLSLLILSPLALCILQRDLNMITDYFITEESEATEQKVCYEKALAPAEETCTQQEISEESYVECTPENSSEVMPEE